VVNNDRLALGFLFVVAMALAILAVVSTRGHQVITASCNCSFFIWWLGTVVYLYPFLEERQLVRHLKKRNHDATLAVELGQRFRKEGWVLRWFPLRGGFSFFLLLISFLFTYLFVYLLVMNSQLLDRATFIGSLIGFIVVLVLLSLIMVASTSKPNIWFRRSKPGKINLPLDPTPKPDYWERLITLVLFDNRVEFQWVNNSFRSAVGTFRVERIFNGSQVKFQPNFAALGDLTRVIPLNYDYIIENHYIIENPIDFIAWHESIPDFSTKFRELFPITNQESE